MVKYCPIIFTLVTAGHMITKWHPSINRQIEIIYIIVCMCLQSSTVGTCTDSSSTSRIGRWQNRCSRTVVSRRSKSALRDTPRTRRKSSVAEVGALRVGYKCYLYLECYLIVCSLTYSNSVEFKKNQILNLSFLHKN